MSREQVDRASFNVLFVCTGNLCRSAFAEVLSRQLFADRLGPQAPEHFAFSSAGVHAVVGAGMHPETRNALGLWGRSLYDRGGAFVSRPLRPHMVQWADLILTAEESHRPEIAWSAPEAVSKLFTLRRFARIVRGLDPLGLPAGPVCRAHAIVAAAARSADLVQPDEDSIPDPIGAAAEQHLQAADMIFDAVGSFVDLVAPPV